MSGGERVADDHTAGDGTTDSPARDDSPADGVLRVAFRTTGEGFLTFVSRLDSVHEIDASGPGDVTDFGGAYSVFFTDPYGHPFEVTTYDDDVVSDALDRWSSRE